MFSHSKLCRFLLLEPFSYANNENNNKTDKTQISQNWHFENIRHFRMLLVAFNFEIIPS